MSAPRMNFLQRLGIWMTNLQDKMREDWVDEMETKDGNIVYHTMEIQRLGREINDWSDGLAATDPVFKAHRDRLRAEAGITEGSIAEAINRKEHPRSN